MFPRTVNATLHVNEIVDSQYLTFDPWMLPALCLPYAFYASELVLQHTSLQVHNIVTEHLLSPTSLSLMVKVRH